MDEPKNLCSRPSKVSGTGRTTSSTKSIRIVCPNKVWWKMFMLVENLSAWHCQVSNQWPYLFRDVRCHSVKVTLKLNHCDLERLPRVLPISRIRCFRLLDDLDKFEFLNQLKQMIRFRIKLIMPLSIIVWQASLWAKSKDVADRNWQITKWFSLLNRRCLSDRVTSC